MPRHQSTPVTQPAHAVLRRAVIETLEGRRLMHAGHEHFTLNVDFQQSATPVFPGYVADIGALYGDRGNGATYGWNKTHFDTSRNRNSSRSPDERYDTFIMMKSNATWNVALPNGTYDVRLVMGDPITWTDRHYAVNIEGVLAVDFVPTSAQRFVEGNVTVTVTDGKLTLSSAPDGEHNNVAFIDITTHEDGDVPTGEVPAAPSGLGAAVLSSSQVKLSWVDNAGNEDGFAIERTDNGGVWTQVGSVGADVTSWTNATSGGHTYLYRVRSFNDGGMSAASGTAVGVTPIGAGWTPLFNGVNLNGFDTYTPSTGKVTNPAVSSSGYFSVHDGMLHILNIPATSATKEFGYVVTENTFDSYHMVLEYKWGTKKFAPRQSEKRDSGLLFHLGGTENIWPRGMEAQIQEGDTGDIWMLEGAAASATVVTTTTSPRQFKEGGTPYRFSGGGTTYSRLKKSTTVDSLSGWNKVELYVTGDEAAVIVNGKLVNRVYDIRRPDSTDPSGWRALVEGRIGLQAEGAEVFYRNMQIRPLDFSTAPFDATKLFSGGSTSAWRSSTDGGAIDWDVSGGELVVDPGTGNIRTNSTYQDFKLHVEFRTPFVSTSAAEQDRGNSGIYLQGRYEIQILDSFQRTLADRNDLGAVYGQRNASTNAALPAELWQSYDITFTAARWSNGVKVSDARVTVVLNGITIHDDVALSTNTAFGSPEGSSDGPIVLQDHNNRVRFRNIWIQPL